jgi:hypothetical protein
MNTIKPFVALVAFVLLAAPALAQETKAKRTQDLATHSTQYPLRAHRDRSYTPAG